ncbi:hypothetical protein GH5_05581 [Leishmania sp. Ghana 2012 LV757]|uniref:hypothetical protein n=1 Tax=Leishmania sp. Ghana 2012 LV757 TaxID=2803181 RepID=UPI001B7B18A5|nr:hypothetical protein GH5_05581 [Leishmania sp. Ghana 2012 LV757]
MLFGQLVCYGCHRIITHPLGAVTCRCRLCNTINAAQNLLINCDTCGQVLHAPINTLTLLCPCCGTITDIPEALLPPLPSCISLGGGPEEAETVIYVSHPTLPLRSRFDGEASVSTVCLTGSRRLSVPPRGNEQPRSPLSPRRRLSSKAKDTSVAQGCGEENVVDCDATDACEEDRKRRESADPSATEEETGFAATVSETSGTVRLVAPSRLAPTVMIATRIL